VNFFVSVLRVSLGNLVHGKILVIFLSRASFTLMIKKQESEFIS